jgi:hypothetical protein
LAGLLWSGSNGALGDYDSAATRNSSVAPPQPLAAPSKRDRSESRATAGSARAAASAWQRPNGGPSPLRATVRTPSPWMTPFAQLGPNRGPSNERRTHARHRRTTARRRGPTRVTRDHARIPRRRPTPKQGDPLPGRSAPRRRDRLARGALLVRNGKGGKRREVGMDEWGWEQLRPWHLSALTVRVALVWAVTSDRCGWFSGWRRADSSVLCRLPG